MDVPVPCRYIPAYGQAMFDPGFVFRASGEPLATITLSESSRYTGFWKFLGTCYTRTRFDLILRVGGEHVLTLEARAKNNTVAPDNRLLTPTGEPAGHIHLERNGFGFKKWASVVIRDGDDRAIGTIDWKASPISQELKLFDTRHDSEYKLVYETRKTVSWFLESDRADVIDARLLLAWCFYSHFWVTDDSD